MRPRPRPRASLIGNRQTDLPDFVSGQRPVAVSRVPVGRARDRGLVRLRRRVSLVRPQTHVVLDAGVVLVLVRHFTLPISSVGRSAQEQTPHSIDRRPARRTWSVLALGYLKELPGSAKKEANYCKYKGTLSACLKTLDSKRLQAAVRT